MIFAKMSHPHWFLVSRLVGNSLAIFLTSVVVPGVIAVPMGLYFAFWHYLTPNMLWYFVPLLLIGTISQSVVYGEIRLATESVWPAWVMHTIGNAFGNALLLSGFIQLNSGKELWFTPGAEGLVSIILMFAIGYWLNQQRKRYR